MQVLRKRLCLPLMLLALMFVLTSCIRINMDITIKKDGKADVSLLFAVQDSLGSMAGNEEGLGLSEEEANKYRADGWEVKDYAADGYTGYTLSKENVDLSQTDLMEGAEGSIRKEGSLYIVDIDLFSDSDQKEFTESAAMLKSMGGSFTIHLTLPEKPVKHNATSVSADGKTLEWDVFSMNAAEPIHVEFKMVNYALIAAVVAAIAAALAVVAFVLMKRSKPQADEAANAAEESATAGEESVTAGEESANGAEETVSAPTEAVQQEMPPVESVTQEISPAGGATPRPQEMPLVQSTETEAGEAVPAVSLAQEATAQQEIKPQKICRNCGSILADNHIFCPICGTKVEADPENNPHNENAE